MKRIAFLCMALTSALSAAAMFLTLNLQESEGDTYAFLTFETTEGMKASVAVASLTVSVNGSALTAGSQTFELMNLSKMYFSATDETTGLDDTMAATTGEIIEVYDLRGRKIPKEQMKKGVFVVKSKEGTYKIVAK